MCPVFYAHGYMHLHRAIWHIIPCDLDKLVALEPGQLTTHMVMKLSGSHLRKLYSPIRFRHYTQLRIH